MPDPSPRPEPFSPQADPARSRTCAHGCARPAGRTRRRTPAGRSGPTSATCASSPRTGRTSSTGRPGDGPRPAAPLPGHARRPRHPLRARQSGQRGDRGDRGQYGVAGPAAGALPRLARLVLALLEGHRAAHRPGRARRRPGRRVRRGRAGHAGLRVLRPPGRPAARLHRRGRPVGRADGRPRLRQVRRGRRRHRQRRQPLPRARLSGPGRGGPPHRRGRARLRGRPGRPHATRSAPGSRTSPAWGAAEGAYGAMHRTKPQTAAFGLTDSPVGLAAWIVEKLRAWSDCDGDVERRFSKDEILTNVTLYWLTGDDRLVDAHVQRQRRDRARAARPPGRGAVRLRALPGRHHPPADGVARAHGERRAGDRAAPRRPLRARSRSQNSTRPSCASSSAPTARSGEADVQEEVPEPNVTDAAARPVHEACQAG